MDSHRKCTRCGAALPADAPEGHCLSCLLSLGLERGNDPVGETAGPEVVLEDQAGERLGGYQLREKIGEGGCGIVYRAEQLEPVQREVAVKIIKLGMDTKTVIARFEAERQTLA
jgi:hypothetical protein